jgi:guanine nucleotide-binding protein G(i) subunit alpha
MEYEQLTPKELKARSRQIDRLLAQEKKKMRDQVVLLMLGPGQSGKSTFCKQMKILHLFGFTENEKENYKWVVHNNVIDAILDLIGACLKLSIPFDSKENKKLAKGLYATYRQNEDNEEEVPQTVVHLDQMNVRCFTLNKDLAENIKLLWQDTGIRQAYDRRSEFALSDGAAYYLNDVLRLAEDNYVPNDIDILCARVRTTAVNETTFEWEQTRFRVVDVGGQRGERSKWLPLFTDVNAILFCVAMSEYDLVMEEDGKTNRMIDALELWESIVNNPYLSHVPMILFLNKKDLFEKKIKTTDLNVCFRDYKGGKNYEKAVKFLETKFLSVVKEREGKIYPQVTQATDTKNIQYVWSALKDVFVAAAVKDATGVDF